MGLASLGAASASGSIPAPVLGEGLRGHFGSTLETDVCISAAFGTGVDISAALGTGVSVIAALKVDVGIISALGTCVSISTALGTAAGTCRPGAADGGSAVARCLTVDKTGPSCISFSGTSRAGTLPPLTHLAVPTTDFSPLEVLEQLLTWLVLEQVLAWLRQKQSASGQNWVHHQCQQEQRLSASRQNWSQEEPFGQQELRE